jgi:multimeric flavodoxin WrbA
MHVLGISGGRRMGNSEILLKEALMGVEEQGASVEFLRLLDLTIKPPLGEDLPGVSDDQAPMLNKKLLECDGIILGAPVFCITAPGYIMTIRDRVSGRHSVPKKLKMAGLIAVGGTDWVNLALPTMYLFLPHGHVKLVDQMVLPFTSHLGQVVVDDKAIARARKLGLNIGQALKLPEDKVQYAGDDYWACPVCRQNLLQIRGKEVECPICAIKGKIEVKGGEIKAVFPANALKAYRWGPDGLKKHGADMKSSDVIFKEKQAEIKKRLKKYEAYNPTV